MGTFPRNRCSIVISDSRTCRVQLNENKIYERFVSLYESSFSMDRCRFEYTKNIQSHYFCLQMSEFVTQCDPAHPPKMLSPVYAHNCLFIIETTNLVTAHTYKHHHPVAGCINLLNGCDKRKFYLTYPIIFFHCLSNREPRITEEVNSVCACFWAKK